MAKKPRSKTAVIGRGGRCHYILTSPLAYGSLKSGLDDLQYGSLQEARKGAKRLARKRRGGDVAIRKVCVTNTAICNTDSCGGWTRPRTHPRSSKR